MKSIARMWIALLAGVGMWVGMAPTTEAKAGLEEIEPDGAVEHQDRLLAQAAPDRPRARGPSGGAGINPKRLMAQMNRLTQALQQVELSDEQRKKIGGLFTGFRGALRQFQSRFQRELSQLQKQLEAARRTGNERAVETLGRQIDGIQAQAPSYEALEEKVLAVLDEEQAQEVRSLLEGSESQPGERDDGLQVGQKMPELTVHDLQGDSIELSSFWEERPALIVTASPGSPRARKTIAALPALARPLEDRVDFVVLVTESAVAGSSEASEGRGAQGRRRGRQSSPQVSENLEQRLRAVRPFKRALQNMPIVVDNLENEAREKLGGSGNMAILVNSDGEVIARQSQFEPRQMQERLIHLLQTEGDVESAPRE